MDVTNHLFENSNHRIDFAEPKLLNTARNQTKLFILETLCFDKLKPFDQPSITLYQYLFRAWFACFFFCTNCIAQVSQKYYTHNSVHVAVAQQHVYNQQVLHICSTILQLVL